MVGGTEEQDSFGGSMWHDMDAVAARATPPAATPHTSPATAPVAGPAAAVQRRLSSEDPLRYDLRSEQGRGGMGRVLLAYDSYIEREVALKELLPPAAGGPQTTGQRGALLAARFLREARITGQLEHPGIVPVHEVGQRADGTVYYTMKLVRGVTLEQKLRTCTGLADRLKLLPHFVDLCHAIAYAHSRHVIHRDIKPANVMVGEFGETLLLDWGLAKAQGEQDHEAARLAEEVQQMLDAGAGESVMGRPIGTPSYMPPEQADGRIAEIDERSDVWSLGAVLYELLTGRPPFGGANAYEVVAQVIKGEMQPVLAVCKEAPAELAAVAQRCLERDPARRYATVRQLVADVTAFQEGGLVGVYAYSPGKMLLRWARRRWPVLVTASAALVIMAVGATLAYAQVVAQRNRAVAANARLDRENNELLGLKLAAESRDQLKQGQSERAALLALQAATFHGRASQSMPDINRALRECAAAPWFARELGGSGGLIRNVAVSPDGKLLATVGDNVAGARVMVYDLNNPGHQPLPLTGTYRAAVQGLAFSPDGSLLAAAANDMQVRVWHVQQPAVAPVVIATPDVTADLSKPLMSVAFSPDGRLLAAGGNDQHVRLWSVADLSAAPQVLEDTGNEIRQVGFSRDGRWLAAACRGKVIHLWDVTGPPRLAAVLAGGQHDLMRFCFRPDSQALAACGDDNVVLWDLPQQLTAGASVNPALLPPTLQPHPVLQLDDLILGLDYSPDGTQLAVGTNNDKLVRIYATAHFEAAPQVLAGHSDHVYAVEFTPDGTRLISGSDDMTARVWQLKPENPEPRVFHAPDAVAAVALSPDKQRLAAAVRAAPGLLVWDLDAPDHAPHVAGGDGTALTAMALSPDGHWLAGAGADQAVWLWALDQVEAPPRKYAGPPVDLAAVAFSPDGHWLAAAGGDYKQTTTLNKAVRLWDLTAPGAQPRLLNGPTEGVTRSLVFTQDGHLLGSTPDVPELRTWNLSTGQYTRVELPEPQSRIALSHDGSHLAGSGMDGLVRIWSYPLSGEEPRILRGHDGRALPVAFDPASPVLASGGMDATVRLWDLDGDNQKPEVLLGDGQAVLCAAFSADGQQLVTGGVQGEIRLWSVSTRQLLASVSALPWRNLTPAEWVDFVGPDVPYEATLPQFHQSPAGNQLR